MAEADGARTLSDFSSNAQGAFPTVVAARLEALGIPVAPDPGLGPLAQQPDPELHPLDFEWYFSRQCADRLAAMLASRGGHILCLGAPTVAEALAARGHDAVLVDRNPLVRARLGAVAARLDLRTHDLDAPLEATHQFDAVFFDAPWYPEIEELWLWQASRAVRPGGLILFSLLPQLVRPTATEDRSAILAEAAALGRATVLEGALRYDTPLFEAEALDACGLPRLPAWRVADLVRIDDVHNAASRKPPEGDIADTWDTWVIGSQVVKLRRTGHDNPAGGIGMIPGARGWAYKSVSRREGHRELIDLWTSRNRVARVGARREVATALDALARNSDARTPSGAGEMISSDALRLALAAVLSD